ncbi:TPA: hypothetical protein NJ582_001088 [Vibrio parahaemolyticus]|nr:hypothetical protein [Vibrio parahaemolyticus]HCG8447415.1 hypothetical protein [Vibrio parahaemolyticus]
MKGIPSTPTDNLYKFSAVAGLWFFAGLVASYIWLVSIEIKLDEELQKSSVYWRSLDAKNDLELRLISIKKGELESNEINWIPKQFKGEKELDFISNEILRHNEIIEENKKFVNTDTGSKLALLSRNDVVFMAFGYIIIMSCLLVFGFFGWYKNIHKKDNEIKDLDIEIKKKAIYKVNLEINQMNNAYNSNVYDKLKRYSKIKCK